MSAYLARLSAFAEERGWLLVESAGPWLIVECMECEAREKRVARAIQLGLAPCTHPVTDGARSYTEDVATQRLLNEWGPMTLDEIGACLKVSKERARQVVDAALESFRAAQTMLRLEDMYRERESARRALHALAEAEEAA